MITERSQMHIMILLKNIKRKDNVITMDAFIEDCAEALPLIYDVQKQDFQPYVPPKGYEWCRGHVAHAKWNLQKILKNNEELPEMRHIMWY